MIKQWLLWGTLFFTYSATQANESLKQNVERALPGVTVEQIQSVAGTELYQGVIDGQLLYFTADGKYILQGDLIDVESKTNLTELKRQAIKQQQLANLDQTEMIIYRPEQVKHTLTVFTDIDCGYCRKLHQQMDDYLALGIEIRYMAFPRSGPGTASYQKAINVWCASDRQKALTEAKLGETIDSPQCQHPIDQHLQLGMKLGVRGTPALFTASGELLPGYIPPKRLIQILDDN